jgi:hypothetical protein
MPMPMTNKIGPISRARDLDVFIRPSLPVQFPLHGNALSKHAAAPGPPLRQGRTASVGPVLMPHRWIDFDEARAPIDMCPGFPGALELPSCYAELVWTESGTGPSLAVLPGKKSRPQHRCQASISACGRLGQFGLTLKQQGNSCPRRSDSLSLVIIPPRFVLYCGAKDHQGASRRNRGQESL